MPETSPRTARLTRAAATGLAVVSLTATGLVVAPAGASGERTPPAYAPAVPGATEGWDLVADDLTSLGHDDHDHGVSSSAAARLAAPQASVKKAKAALKKARTAQKKAVSALAAAEKRFRSANAAVVPAEWAATAAAEDLSEAEDDLWDLESELWSLESNAEYAADDHAYALGYVETATLELANAERSGDPSWVAQARAELAEADRSLVEAEKALTAARSALTAGQQAVAAAERRVDAARTAAEAAEQRASNARTAAGSAQTALLKAQDKIGTTRLRTAKAYRTYAHARAPRSTRSAPYVLMSGEKRNPARWNACTGPITVRVSTPALKGSREKKAGVAEARKAVKILKKSSRLPLVFKGTTKEVPRNGVQVSSADIVISYSSPKHSPGMGLEGSTIGVGGSWFSLDALGNLVRKNGMATIDVPDARRATSAGHSRLSITLHELGHAVGLGHVSNRNQLMNPSLTSSTPRQFAKGDRNGLKALRLHSDC